MAASYEQAVQALRSRLSDRWEGQEIDGRNEMVAILKRELGYSSDEANDAIDGMITTGTLRYHRLNSTEAGASAVPPVAAIGGIAGSSPGQAGVGMPLAAGALMGVGFWQIGGGGGTADDGWGRPAGQVDPLA